MTLDDVRELAERLNCGDFNAITIHSASAALLALCDAVKAAGGMACIPAVIHILGTRHTDLCKCPRCQFESALVHLRELK